MATKNTRFVTMCYSLAAVSAAAEGNVTQAGADALLAVASGTCDRTVAYAAYAVAAAAYAIQGRLIGTAGFAAKIAGWPDLAGVLLAFHYGLMAFDAADEPIAARIASGALSINYAM